MWLLPILLPASFPHVAVDGSSTRALWTQLMGLVELVLGAGYLGRHWCLPAFASWLSATKQRRAVSTAAWQPDAQPENVLAVDFADMRAQPSAIDAMPELERRLVEVAVPTRRALAAIRTLRKLRGAEARFLHVLARLRELAQRGPSTSHGVMSFYGPRDSLVALVQSSLGDLHRVYSMKPDEFDEHALAMLSELLAVDPQRLTQRQAA